MPIYDITVPITPSIVRWPGDPPVTISHVKTVVEHGYGVSVISLGSHTGTHIDAPLHFWEKGQPVDRVPLELLVGKAHVFEVEPEDGLVIRPVDLAAAGIPRDATRLLLKTSNSALWGAGPQSFEERYVHLDKKAARWLVERGVRLVGFDYLSVDGYPSDETPVHRELLGAGLVIVEGLDLSGVTPGVYQLVALPLKVIGADGAPVRAVLIR